MYLLWGVVTHIHTDQYLLFDSHHPMDQKLAIIRTLNHGAETVPTKAEGREKEQKHIRGAFKTCGYPNWTFVKTSKRSRADREKETRKPSYIIIPYVVGASETLRRNKHYILVHLKPTNTLRQTEADTSS